MKRKFKDVGSGYFKLLDGEFAGRVAIKSTVSYLHNSHKDKASKRIVLFTSNLTWMFEDELDDVLCERVMPTGFEYWRETSNYGVMVPPDRVCDICRKEPAVIWFGRTSAILCESPECMKEMSDKYLAHMVSNEEEEMRYQEGF